MGEPVRIRELAEQMIRFHGYEPDKDIPIVYTGLRPGEKLHEKPLGATSETPGPTALPRSILRAQAQRRPRRSRSRAARRACARSASSTRGRPGRYTATASALRAASCARAHRRSLEAPENEPEY